jgi:4-amino-4-deoxy-L-arabinose transferase-like glycosyltransferase
MANTPPTEHAMTSPLAPRSSQLLRLVALLIILLAFGLRVCRLDYQELRGDESFGYFFVQRSYTGMIDATIELAEPHPVGSYYLLKPWLGAAGDSEFALRFPSAWFGVLAVALTLRLAMRLGFRRGTSLLAALLLAISPYAIWHSQDARMYSMSMALTVAAVWLGVETLQRQRVRWGAAYVGVAWLALHMHYYAAFVLVALNFFVLTRAIFIPTMRANLANWLMWQLIVGALYLPWLVRAATIVGGYGGNGDSPTFAAMAQRSLSVFAVGESSPVDQQLLWAGVAGTLLLVATMHLSLGSAADRRNLWLLLCYLMIPMLMTWWSAQDRPIFNERYLAASAPPFFLLVAAAFDGRRFTGWREQTLRWLARLLLAALLAGMTLSLYRHYTDPTYSKTRGWRELAAAIDRYAAGLSPDWVRIAQNFPDPTLWYYYRGAVEHVMLPPAPHDETGAQTTVDALQAADVRRILLPLQPAPNWDDREIAVAALAGNLYDRVHQEQVGVWPLLVYAGHPHLHVENALDYTFENGFALTDIATLEGQHLTPGGLLTFTLFGARPPSEELGALKLTAQLLDSAGVLVAQQDTPLTEWHSGNGRSISRSYGLLLPAELTPGRYRLIAAVYDSAAEDLPRLRTLGGADVVELGALEGGR